MVLYLSALVISLALFFILFLTTQITKAEKNLKENFSKVLVCFIITTILNLVELSVSEFLGIESKLLTVISFVPLSIFPIYLLKSALAYFKPEKPFTNKIDFLFAVPAFLILGIITNDFHHLFFETANSTIRLSNTGPLMFFSIAFIVFLSVFSFLLFLYKTSKATSLLSTQTLMLLIGLFSPMSLYFAGLSGFLPFPIYLLPVGYAISSTFLVLTIFNMQFIATSPIALRYIVDNISDSYIVLTSANNIMDFNKQFLDTFKVSAFDLRNEDLFEFLKRYTIKNLSTAKFKEALETVKTTTTIISKQIEIPELNKHFSVEITDIRAKKTYLGTLVLFKDISQHKEDMVIIKENQEKLMEREHLVSLGQTIGGIAHNLKTPIMAISGSIEGIKELNKEFDLAIEDDDVTDSDMHEISSDIDVWIDKIKNQLSYMSDVITAVKGQAVALGNNQAFPFPVSDLFKQVEILMKHELNNAFVELVVDNQIPDSISINGNINALTQVVNNIISNAIDAYVSNKIKHEKIDLKAHIDKDTIIISIKDYGPGLPEMVKKKLFKEMITTKGKEGTGLGMYMSYSTIKAYFSGNIKFESKPDKGTTFNIIIPYKKLNSKT